MVESIDDSLGRVMATLQELKLDETTVIIFTSDNGPVLRRDAELGLQMRFNGVFSGDKESVLEGGLRVPAIVAWPEHIPSGRVESTPVHGCDWLPTLYSLAEKPAKPKYRAWQENESR
jgi:arylsulfatase A-like enzyme